MLLRYAKHVLWTEHLVAMRLVWRTALIINTERGQRKQQIATFPVLSVLRNQQLSFSMHAVSAHRHTHTAN